MAKSKLAILIETLYKGKGAKDAQKDLKGMEKGVSMLDSAWVKAGIAGAAVFSAVAVGKKAFEFGAEGAQIIRTRDAFERLSESVGESYESMLESQRNATAGMVSDTDLMTSTSRLLAMGLAESSDEAARLNETAVLLGSAMGKGPTEAMEEFALLLANQSIPRLDTFGISAGTVRTRIKELREEFPNMTRETAFMQATMEQAALSVDKLGGELEPDNFSTATAEFSNLNDELKILAADLLGPIAGGVASFLRGMRESHAEAVAMKEAVAEMEEMGRESGVTAHEMGVLLDTLQQLDAESRDSEVLMRRYNLAIELLGDGLADDEVAAADLAIQMDRLDQLAASGQRIWEGRIQQYKDSIVETDDLTDATVEAKDAFSAWTPEMKKNLVAAHALEIQAEDTADVFGEWSDEMKENLIAAFGLTIEMAEELEEATTEALDEATEAYERFIEAQWKMHNQLIRTGVSDAIDDQYDFNTALLDSVLAATDSGEAYVALGLALGEFTDAEAAAILKHIELATGVKILSDLYATGALSPGQMLDAIDTLGNEGLPVMQEMVLEQQRHNDLMGLFPEELEKVRAKTWEFGEEFLIAHQNKIIPLLDDLDNIAGDYDVNVNVNVNWRGTLQDLTAPDFRPGGPPTTENEPPPREPTPRPGGPQAQHGLDMIVPPGFYNDSFPIWAESGERVTVQTKAQQQQGGMGGNTFNIHYYSSGGTATDARRLVGMVADELGARG